jgi:ferredoxin
MDGSLAPPAGTRLAVDPIACEAVGLCAQLSAGLVRLDRWGYPVMPDRLADGSHEDRALRAVRGCPRRALALLPASNGPAPVPASPGQGRAEWS